MSAKDKIVAMIEQKKKKKTPRGIGVLNAVKRKSEKNAHQHHAVVAVKLRVLRGGTSL
jgi:hypothetical protein